jgi:hypothetical protein
MKILADAQKMRSKILTKKDPLELEDKPMDGLTGCIMNEMVQLKREKESWK